MIHVIDYQIGNIGSVVNMLNHIGAKAVVATSPKDLERAEKIILPGVGAFDAGMEALQNLGFDEAIKNAVADNKAMLLGICLGMQLLMEFSEEGDKPGLGLVPGHVKKFTAEHEKMRIPHMGWNVVDVVRTNRLFNQNLIEANKFYFVHSFFVNCSDDKDVIGLTPYGSKFTSAFERQTVLGVQFHPEKSHSYGKALFKNFMEASL